jgi:hypothetical protein
MSPYRYPAFHNIVQSRDKLDKTCFGRTRTAYDSYSLPGFDFEAAAAQSRVFCIFAVAEAHIVKNNCTVLNFKLRVTAVILNIYFFINNFNNTE